MLPVRHDLASVFTLIFHNNRQPSSGQLLIHFCQTLADQSQNIYFCEFHGIAPLEAFACFKEILRQILQPLCFTVDNV